MKLKTLEPIEHDGKKIKPGSYIEVDEAAARQLVDAGAAEAAGKGKAATSVPTSEDVAEGGEAEQGK